MLIVVIWALAEAMLFFIVADVPISAIGLRSGCKPAIKAAVAASLAAAFGGVIVQIWAAADPHGFRGLLLQIPGISNPMIVQASTDFANHGVLAMLYGSFSGTPYKLYAHAAAGNAALPFWVASICARLPRFLLVAAASSVIGGLLQSRMQRWQIALLFVAFWTLFYATYFRLMSGQ